MDELIAWTRTQLDDDERVAREAAGAPWSTGIGGMVHVDASAIAENRAWRTLGYVASVERDGDREHIARWDPKRALAEVDAKRRILERHAAYDFPADEDDGPGAYSWTPYCDHCHQPWPCPDLRDASSPFADREGYREEWRP